ncbi:fibronectin type III domain protein, partial [Candidatus Magnetomorum sp. HK-1]
NTFMDKELLIVDQQPLPGGVLPANTSVSIQFNQIIDPDQIKSLGSTLFDIRRSGVIIDGYVSGKVNNMGTCLSFRPNEPFEPNKEYDVFLSGAISSIKGKTLADDYQFKFITEQWLLPIIHQIFPVSGSINGGTEITIKGEHFCEQTQIKVGDIIVPQENIIGQNANEIAFKLPALNYSIDQNQWLGLNVQNGLLNTFLPAHFKYVMDPSIEAIGQYDPVSGKLNASDQLFFYQSSEYAAIRGSGLDQLTAIHVNNQPAQDVDIVDPETIYFKIPDQTIGQLKISVSNASDKSDQVENTSLSIMLKSGIRANGIHSFARHDDYLMLLDSSSKKATIYTTRDSENPVKLSSILFQIDIQHIAMSDTYALFVAESNQEIMIYDLSNIYAPVLTNRIVSPIVDDIHKIVLSN